MLSFREFIAEAYSKAELSNLRNEGLMFAKNFNRIKSGKDYHTVVQAYFVWATRLEHTIYNGVLGMKSKFDSNKENTESKKLREKMWTIVLNKGEVWGLPNRGIDQIFGRNKVSAGEHGTTSFVYDSVSAPVWERLYQEFDHNRKNLYAKYTRILREAFNALDAYLETLEGDAVESHQNMEKFNFQGVRVEFMYRDENEKDAKQKLPGYLGALKQALAQLKHYGLAELFNSAVFLLDLADSNTWDAGNYDHRGSIRSTAWAHNDPRVIVHEFGHHVYRLKMSAPKRKDWEDFIHRDKVQFTDDDYRIIKSVYDKVVPELLATKDHRLVGTYVVDGVWENVLRRMPQGVTRDMLAAWMKQNKPGGVMHTDSNGKAQVENSFKRFREASEGSFAFNVPTGYSNKNVEEAFCEVFSYFIMDMPLPPIIAHQFSEITGIRKR